MPKLKTHRSTVKRLKISAGGKLMRRRASGHHFLQKKSASRKRFINTPAIITGSIAANLKRALGGVKNNKKSRGRRIVQSGANASPATKGAK